MTIQRVKELRTKRAKALADARTLVNEAGDRALTAEEETRYSAFFADAEKLKTEIDREERLLEAERETAAEDDRRRQERGNGGDAGDEENRGADRDREQRGNGEQRQMMATEGRFAAVPRMNEAERRSFRRFLAGGMRSMTDGELRALQADNDETGGYVVGPQEFVASLIQAVDNATFIRQRATVTMIGRADSIGRPSLDADPSAPIWTTELQTGDEDSSMDFGKRELSPKPLAKRIKVSRKLLRIGAISVEDIIRQRLAYQFAITHENACINGTGANQPLGLMVASSDGISTSRDVSTGNDSTSIRTDGLIEAKYSLKAQYWNSAEWLFHRDAVKQIAKLKDGEGQYLWRDSVQAGEPDMLLGRPVLASEYMPNTFTTGLYVGLLGDFSFYWIADALSMQMQRLEELYAETNQVGFIGRLESDGMPVLEEAFARVKLG